ncbi:polysaccharide export protein [Rhodopirellula maiorica SM1]|uniref:Polysaccharide export protein n=1 Tax=Rhodopirellula maiorica SM1 TaxID=1265738 RepID=M5RR23_9BACT|nr:polysaccharide biosynthesis/export family protein [Rhodopirellula maiorica]EMI16409.1 polysaccharide export protein [Rhodopirellula maiorica SM1]
MPMRTGGYPLNFASLTIEPPKDYILGPNDQLDVTVGGLMKDAVAVPMRVQVMANGMIQLPLVGPVKIGDTNLIEAQRRISDAYSNGYLENPQVNLALAEKGSTSVIVLGEVNLPGAHLLPKYQNDVGHALAAAGGLSEDAADEIEIHRHSNGMKQLSCHRLPNVSGVLDVPSEPVGMSPHGHDSQSSLVDPSQILRIPLRVQGQFQLSKNDITLSDGDVIVVPSRKHEVFFVVGKLSTTNTVRFTIGDRERELGVGFVLPRDREIDVVTAVVMAGYIDPIDSPTTATLHRIKPDGTPMLILVDLIEARCNPRATVLVEPGDIIYLNPDAPWYMRRTIDRIFPEILLSPYNFWIRRSIIGTGDI